MSAENSRLFWLLSFGNFVIGLGAFVVIGIITPISEGLGVSKSSAGIVLTSYAFAYMIASPLAVALTARTERRKVLTIALLLFSVGSGASALAPSIGLLAASRTIAAIGAALFTPVAAGVAVALSSPESRGKALATVFGGISLAQVIGVPLGAWLAYRFGWEVTFWTVTVLATFGTMLIYRTVPQAIRFQSSDLSTIFKTLAEWRTTLAVGFTATFIAAIYVVFTFLGPLIEVSVGDNPEMRSLYLVVFGLGAVAGNWAGGRLADKLGGFRTLVILCIGQALVLPLFSFSPWSPVLFGLLVGVWSSFGWSFMAPQQIRLVAIAPKAQALVLALNAAAIYVGIAIGSAVGAAILAGWGLTALGISGGVVALLALAHLWLSKKVSGQ